MIFQMLQFVVVFVSLRTYSTVWRNADDTVIKKVIYEPKLRYIATTSKERQILRQLCNGYEYQMYEEDDVLMYKQVKKLESSEYQKIKNQTS